MESPDPLPEVAGPPEGRPHAGNKVASPRRPVVVDRPPPRAPEIAKRKAVVSYGRRMLRQRMQPLVVTLNDAGDYPVANEGTITVQPIVPGALVTPALADLSTNPGSTARFTVLPLVKGKLSDARVELRFRGKTVETLALPMKVTRRCFAKTCLALAILVTALLAWDRHVTRWEPSHVIYKVDIPGAAPVGGAAVTGPGQGRAPTGNLTLPPPPKEGESYLKELTYRGEKGIEKWIEDNRDKSETQWRNGTAEVKNLFFMGIGVIHDWKIGANPDYDEKGKSVFMWAFNGWELIRNISMSEVYVGGLLIGVSLLIWMLSGAARGKRTSKVFELALS